MPAEPQGTPMKTLVNAHCSSQSSRYRQLSTWLAALLPTESNHDATIAIDQNPARTKYCDELPSTHVAVRLRSQPARLAPSPQALVKCHADAMLLLPVLHPLQVTAQHQYCVR